MADWYWYVCLASSCGKEEKQREVTVGEKVVNVCAYCGEGVRRKTIKKTGVDSLGSQIEAAPKSPPLTAFTFAFNGKNIRMEWDGKEGWGHLGDICRGLGLTNVTWVAKRLENRYLRDFSISDVTGRKQNQRFVNEHGFYSLVLLSRKPDAKKFHRWIVEEVLPTLRRTGKYEMDRPHTLTELTDTRVQKELSKRISSYFNRRGGEPAIRKYHSDVLYDITGWRPQTWIEEVATYDDPSLTSAEKRSGIALVRRYMPHGAAAVSFDKDQVSRGHDINVVRPLSQELCGFFCKTMKQGIMTGEYYLDIPDTKQGKQRSVRRRQSSE